MADFNWNDLRFFLAVARAGTLTAAGRRMGADHATISRRITALEEVLRVTLFDRTPHGYTLTAHGERLREAAEAMESAAFAAQATIAGADLSVSGAVRIGSPDGFGSYVLAEQVGDLCRRHPGLEVQLVATPRVFSLSKREADIAIGLSRPREGRLVAQKLTDYQLRLYAAPGYLAAHPGIAGRDDLAAHTVIGYIDDLLYAPELDYIRAVGDVTPRIRSSNIIAQLRATVGGAGLCILPCFIADGEPGLVPVLPDDTTIVRSFWMIVHEDTRALARVVVTTDFIADVVRRAQHRLMPY